MKRITDFFWRTGKKPAVSIGKNDSEDFSKKSPLSGTKTDGEILTRIKNERFEELISDGEIGVIKSNLIKVLERDPWNIDALRRMARVSKEIEEQIYHLEILRAHPEDVESLRELLMFESSLHRESSDLSLENLEYRLERIVRLIGIEGLKKNLDILFEVAENSYKKDPYKTRGFALCIFKSISDVSGPIALDFFLICERILLIFE